jgi:hypothetical protein
MWNKRLTDLTGFILVLICCYLMVVGANDLVYCSTSCFPTQQRAAGATAFFIGIVAYVFKGHDYFNGE